MCHFLTQTSCKQFVTFTHSVVLQGSSAKREGDPAQEHRGESSSCLVLLCSASPAQPCPGLARYRSLIRALASRWEVRLQAAKSSLDCQSPSFDSEPQGSMHFLRLPFLLPLAPVLPTLCTILLPLIRNFEASGMIAPPLFLLQGDLHPTPPNCPSSKLSPDPSVL